MAATPETQFDAARDAALPEALYSKLSPGPGRPAQEVALHQRMRIHGAMVEIVSERGYGAVTVRELARLAGVSTRAFYEHFEGKEECFVRTYEVVVQRVAQRIVASQQGERDWRKQLRLAFCAFAFELESKPQVAHLALVEAFAVGPAALEQMRHVEAMFEAMIDESFSRAPDGIGTSPLLVKGIVAGVASVARARLLAGRERELSNLGNELMEWALCYRGESVVALEQLDYRSVPAQLDIATRLEEVNSQVHGDERALILSAVAKLVAADGYSELTVPRIRAAAGISRKSLDAHFDGVEDCFLAALELRASEALRFAARAAQTTGRSWAGGVYQAVVALCAQIAHDPVLARLCFIDVFAPGPEGMTSRERLMAASVNLVREGAPAAQRPNVLAVEASVGAVWGVVHRYVASGRARQLPKIAATLSFLALAPMTGAADATEAIRREQAQASPRT